MSLNLGNEKYNKIDCMMATDNCVLKSGQVYEGYSILEDDLIKQWILEGVL